MPSEFDRRRKQYLIFRLLIVLLGFGLVTTYKVWIAPAPGTGVFEYLYGLLGVYLAFGVTLFLSYPKWKGNHAIVRGQVIADFFFQSLLVWGTGGVLSIFTPLIFVTLVAATSVISARGAFALATLATVFLSATTIAHALGFPPGGLGPAVRPPGTEHSAFVTSYFLGSVLAFYAVSTLGSRFSHGLRRMEGIQSEILENMAEGLLAVDPGGRVFQLNKEARNLLGVAASAVPRARLTLEDVFPGEAHAALRAAFLQERRRRLHASVRRPGTGPEVKERPLEIKISSVRNDAGQTRLRIGLISDLSLQRSIEASARRIQKLQDLQVMALGIAHELRNPLASIRGCVQEIGRLVPADALPQRYMEIVCRESDRLDKIIEDFLVYARTAPVELVPVDLQGVVEEAAVLLKSRPDFGQRTISLSFPPHRPTILGDRNRLIQVFLNLGLNSIDATSETDGKLTIRLEPKRSALLADTGPTQDEADGIEAIFSDNGQGIREEDQKKLFTPFYTTKASGTGLGLSIVDRIVREHHGAIDVSSGVAGAEFRLWFPVARAEAEQGRVEDTSGVYCHA